MPSVGALLKEARRLLAVAPFSPSRREAHLLLGRVLGLSEAELLARDDAPVADADAVRFRALLERRLTGEPVAYLLGEREFYGRTFAVDDRVLVPRPETEHLVEAVLDLELPADTRVLDVGVGSGAIAVTLALERPDWRVTGSDLSPAALAVARGNARCLGARVALAAADLLAGFDLAGAGIVVSNPPYIAPSAARSLSREVTAFEPERALYGAPAGSSGTGDGTALIRRLLHQAEGLASGTPLALEIGHDQMPVVRSLAGAGPWIARRVVTDYGGFERVVVLVRR